MEHTQPQLTAHSSQVPLHLCAKQALACLGPWALLASAYRMQIETLLCVCVQHTDTPLGNNIFHASRARFEDSAHRCRGQRRVVAMSPGIIHSMILSIWVNLFNGSQKINRVEYFWKHSRAMHKPAHSLTLALSESLALLNLRFCYRLPLPPSLSLSHCLCLSTYTHTYIVVMHEVFRQSDVRMRVRLRVCSISSWAGI